MKPPFVPNIDESYFDTDYLAKHMQENPDNYFHVSKVNLNVIQS